MSAQKTIIVYDQTEKQYADDLYDILNRLGIPGTESFDVVDEWANIMDEVGESISKLIFIVNPSPSKRMRVLCWAAARGSLTGMSVAGALCHGVRANKNTITQGITANDWNSLS